MRGKFQKLSDKRKKFVEEYIIDFNGTQAAMRAGYSERNAANQAVSLLSRKDIREAITEIQGDLAKGFNITREDVLKSYLEIREKAMKRNTLTVAVSCNDSICKMLGFNAPEKQEILSLDKIEIEIIGEIEEANVIEEKEKDE